VRLQQSRLLLMTGVDDVATIGYRVGYDSASHFSRANTVASSDSLRAATPCSCAPRRRLRSGSPPSEDRFLDVIHALADPAA
jgi:AraC-like DNA-binding protein